MTNTDSNKPAEPFDPFKPWREWRDMNMDIWAKSMGQFVTTDAYAQAQSGLLNTLLTVVAPLQKATEENMTEWLHRMGMPSRSDLLSLSERLTNIEMRLDDMDAFLREGQIDVSTRAPTASDSTAGGLDTLQKAIEKLTERTEQLAAQLATQQAATDAGSNARPGGAKGSAEKRK